MWVEFSSTLYIEIISYIRNFSRNPVLLECRLDNNTTSVINMSVLGTEWNLRRTGTSRKNETLLNTRHK